MKTIYVVTQGEYSDYHIVGVYSRKEDAEAYCGAHLENGYDTPQVEEYELDAHAALLRRGFRHYLVDMHADGNEATAEQRPVPDSEYEDGSNAAFHVVGYLPLTVGFWSHLWARTPEHAIKVVNERRTRAIANGDLDRFIAEHRAFAADEKDRQDEENRRILARQKKIVEAEESETIGAFRTIFLADVDE